ncbi:MAG TPA: LuxR C-terminal-related transcriptional regulator [Sedimentisphaerales bacterium]|nr:LuxR C-terminal-related transcriptional regulator [Sedimentisphaerales bacterium]HNU29023.1 LuxR C-terminal-related transcriptional regulator [Sedimentisphaerales bacterium]
MKRRPRKHICWCGTAPSVRMACEAALDPEHVRVCHFAEPSVCLETLLATPCDVLIVDLAESEAAGLHLLAQVQQRAPWISTLAIVPPGAVGVAVRALKVGVCECLEQPVRADRLSAEVQGLLARTASLPRSHRTLTEMEVHIVRSILAGKTSQDIATELRRSKRTIDVHRKNIMRKLRADNLADLVRRALAMGLGKEPRYEDAVRDDGVRPDAS